jgi:hypothetical protein
MKLSNVPFRLESKLVRWYYRKTGGRPSSAPYVSGDGFRALAHHRYENADHPGFGPQQVRPHDLVFCDGWLLDRFLAEFAPRIEVPFSVISHNGDPNLTDDRLTAWPPRLEAIFSQNAVAADPRVTALPIGLENRCFHYNGVTGDFDRLRRGPGPSLNRILFAFTVGTNTAVRGPARAALEQNPVADGHDRVNSRAYRKIAARYRFIASPPGNGEDCHRTWEALYLGAIPIVVRSPMVQQFTDRGLSLWVVDSYAQLSGLTEADLAQKYAELSPGLASPWLWMDAWKTLISSRNP